MYEDEGVRTRSGRGQDECTRACGRGNEDEACGADERESEGIET